MEWEKGHLSNLLAEKEAQCLQTNSTIDNLRTSVVGHAEEVAERTKREMEAAIASATREVKSTTEDTVRLLVEPLDRTVKSAAEDALRTKAEVESNKGVLQRVDDKFAADAGLQIVSRLEEMHKSMCDVYERLDATQKRLESMERTRLLEAEGAVATGILDDEEFVLVYVGPSAVSKVVLAHIRECKEGEYQITAEMQVGPGCDDDATLFCTVTELDIVIEKKDGDEGWISDLRFFLPRPANRHKLLLQAEKHDDVKSGSPAGSSPDVVEESEFPRWSKSPALTL